MCFAETVRENEGKRVTYPRWIYDLAFDFFSNFVDDGGHEIAFYQLHRMTNRDVRELVDRTLNNPELPKKWDHIGYYPANKIFPLAWEAHKLIERALTNSEKPVVMASFGKDSSVVLHLVLQHRPDVYVLWNNTLVEMPTTYRFARRLTKEWNLNLVEARPESTFWDVVQHYGWPIRGRKRGRNEQNRGDLASTMCCKLLKKIPTMKAIKEYGWDLTLTGMTRHESDIRELSARQRGNYFYSKTWGGHRCHPIQDWTVEMVYLYHDMFRLPINDAYRPIPPEIDAEQYIAERDEWKESDRFDWEDQYYLRKLVPKYEVRVGCWPCQIAGRYGYRSYLRHFYPDLYNHLIVKRGLGEELLKKLHGDQPMLYSAEVIMGTSPCYFDEI